MPESHAPASNSTLVPRDEHLVVLIHGIRTQASWSEMVAAVLESLDPVKVIPLRYGYFDIFRFFCPIGTRSGPVKKILRELRDIRAAHPNAKISVIAHSFGTYAVMKALEEREIMLHRLILCGSIIPEKFRRADFRAQLGPDPVLNDCGTHDIWPPMAKSLTWGYGATGTFGLGTFGVRDRFNKFGHSDFFNKEFVSTYWAPYIHEGKIVPTEWEQQRHTPPWWQSMLAWFPFKYLMLMLVLVTIWTAAQASYNSGEATVELGDHFNVGHYIGVPYVAQRLTFKNTTRKEQTIRDIRLTLVTPDGGKIPMTMEGVLLPGSMQPPLPQVSLLAGQEIWFDYSFFNATDAFHSLLAEVSQHFAQHPAPMAIPDESRTLIPASLAEKAATLARSQFIWKPGRWTMILTARTGNKTLEAVQMFTLSDQEVSRMFKVTEKYGSGIGVVPTWRMISMGDFQPVLSKISEGAQ